MARSLRSKRRQKNNRLRRKKFGEREVLKAWEHFKEIKARRLEEGETPGVDMEGTQDHAQEVSEMETGEKVSKKDIAKWALSRNQKKKLAKKRKSLKLKKRKY